MSDMWDESVFPLGPDEIDVAAMGLVLLMVRAQQRGGDNLATTAEYPPITKEEVWEWRN